MNQFATDVQKGLTQSPKRISSRYFYDETGSRLFQQIMGLEEYYLTRAEFEILATYQGEMIAAFAAGVQNYQLVELGAGDGLKTRLLLEQALKEKTPFQYTAIDISRTALDGLESNLRNSFPELKATYLHTDYFNALAGLRSSTYERLVVLFLGANIGNMPLQEARDFVKNIAENLRFGDMIVLGIDLRKDPASILAAYNDAQGVTRAFNLNLLVRINRELGADFDLEAFAFYPTYNIETGEVRSYLLSTRAQRVRIDAVGMEVDFAAWEYIHTEISRKYSPKEIEELALSTGCKVEFLYYDSKNRFVNAVITKQ